FGQMSQIEPFVQLCQSVQQQLAIVSLAEIKDLAQKALKLWERSHALVLVGRLDKLPIQVGGVAESNSVTATNDIFQPDIADIINSAELAAIQDFTTQELASDLDLDKFIPDAGELSKLDAAFGSIDDSAWTSQVEDVVDLDELTPDVAELLELNAAFATVNVVASEAKAINDASLTPKISDISTGALQKPKLDQGRMVKVPVEQLQRLNDLSSKLILERNAAILRFKQLQNFMGLTRERMRRLEKSSNQLRKLYDWASLEGMIPTAQPEALAVTVPWQSASSSLTEEKFDALEMDRYTDLHLLSQEQMETIVQLQEVTTDIDLGIQEMGQVIRNFSYTTRELQQNITRSQMRPFSELVKRFPRLIRDLATQHQKPVGLEIVGETTYVDRQALELLSDPLTHLLRNAFDHGIEDSATRLAAAKATEGKIVLKAVQKGNQTVITITDDG
ncbi:MAG: hybrid sensor histidine kinase/response regulator, partial [Waterburya sp.]